MPSDLRKTNKPKGDDYQLPRQCQVSPWPLGSRSPKGSTSLSPPSPEDLTVFAVGQGFGKSNPPCLDKVGEATPSALLSVVQSRQGLGSDVKCEAFGIRIELYITVYAYNLSTLQAETGVLGFPPTV